MPQASDTTQRVLLTFDGVFRNSQVWVNNFYCGTHFSGYTGFSYDITDFIKYEGENTIVVRADASQFEGWFYEGAGIYRHVWLETMDNFHFARDGVFVYATLPNSTFDKAEVMVEVEVENTYNKARTAEVVTSLYDKDGRKVAGTASTPVKLLPNAKHKLNDRLTVINPQLWDLDNPVRYKAVSEIIIDGKVVDKVNTRFGIRDIKIDNNKGLFLNGRNIKIQGVCCHQDHAGNGVRSPQTISVENGLLVITAQMKEVQEEIGGVMQTVEKLYSGGMAHKENYKYGKFEFRVHAEADPSGAMSAVVLTWPKSENSPMAGKMTYTKLMPNRIRTAIISRQIFYRACRAIPGKRRYITLMQKNGMW